MTKNNEIYFDNFFYYHYLIILKLNLILNNKNIKDINKRIENFEYFLIKQLEIVYYSEIFQNIYNTLNNINIELEKFNIKFLFISFDNINKFIIKINDLNKTINEIKNWFKINQLTPSEPPPKFFSSALLKLPQNPPQAAPKMLNTDLVLINTVGDGDCFINAIFDYGLYTNKIHKIFNKLINIEKYIIRNLSSYNNNIIEINNLIENFNLNNNIIYIDEYNENNLIYESITNNSIWKVDNIEDKFNIIHSLKYYYTHNDQVNRNKYYDLYRNNFIKFMKYIWALYCYTIYYENFKINIRNLLLNEYANDMNFIYPKEIATHIKNNYYDNDTKKQNINYDNLANEYINLYYKTSNIYSSEFEIAIFTIMFKNKIDEYDNEMFVIDHKYLNNIQSNYKDNPMNNNISIILENNEHFLLCLYYEEIFSIFKLN
jgi:hypothetical protein